MGALHTQRVTGSERVLFTQGQTARREEGGNSDHLLKGEVQQQQTAVDLFNQVNFLIKKKSNTSKLLVQFTTGPCQIA